MTIAEATDAALMNNAKMRAGSMEIARLVKFVTGANVSIRATCRNVSSMEIAPWTSIATYFAMKHFGVLNLSSALPMSTV